MCGVAGIASQVATVDKEVLEHMVGAIAHRGPNHAAVHIEHRPGLSVGLGYCRLSIIDLSPAGNQPMINEAGDVWVVYNGELYNHAALRSELEAKGRRYSSRSDSETVLRSYEEWGIEAFMRFKGMFAFAVYDRKRDSLILARDRRGIKPMYYRWDGQSLTFSSELKALLKASPARPGIDPTALWLFLCLGYVPSPYCMVAGVHKLEPGHFLELRAGKLRIERYSREADPPDEGLDERAVVNHVRESVEVAVQQQLMSDVPVGVFLSGGLDSTIVATLASRYHREPLHTFSIGYSRAEGAAEIDSRYNDDFLLARQIAERLGTVHHEVFVENSSALADLFPKLVFQLDEPMVEPVFVSTHYLSKLASECGVPVVLTGDGADELFGGYDRYFAAQRLAVYRKIPGLRRALPFVETVASSRYIVENAHELRYLLDHRTPVESYIRFSSIYRPEQALSLLSPDLRAAVDTEALGSLVQAALGPAASFVDQMAHADLVLWVGEHFNPRLDRVSMLHAIEARVPFQDDRVVTTALSIPTRLKSTRHSRKGLLKRAFDDLVPDLIRARPKRSYQAPGAAWLQGGLAATCGQVTEGHWDRAGLFNAQLARQHLLCHGRDATSSLFPVWALVMAEFWARQYLEGETVSTYV